MNEYANYSVHSEFFTSKKDIKRWVKATISNYGNWVNIKGKTIDEVIDEYNGHYPKYSIIVDSHYFPNLVDQDGGKESDTDDTYTDDEKVEESESSSYESGDDDLDETDT
jgi:hypothetical protein